MKTLLTAAILFCCVFVELRNLRKIAWHCSQLLALLSLYVPYQQANNANKWRDPQEVSIVLFFPFFTVEETPMTPMILPMNLPMSLPMIFMPCTPAQVIAPRRFLDAASSARTNATPSTM
jgi:hypothetical protein